MGGWGRGHTVSTQCKVGVVLYCLYVYFGVVNKYIKIIVYVVLYVHIVSYLSITLSVISLLSLIFFFCCISQNFPSWGLRKCYLISYLSSHFCVEHPKPPMSSNSAFKIPPRDRHPPADSSSRTLSLVRRWH